MLRFEVTDAEIANINRIINYLAKAKKAKTESEFIDNLKNAFRDNRHVIRNRLD